MHYAKTHCQQHIWTGYVIYLSLAKITAESASIILNLLLIIQLYCLSKSATVISPSAKAVIFLCMSVSKVTTKLWTNFDEIFWTGGMCDLYNWLNFGGDLDHDADTRKFIRIYNI